LETEWAHYLQRTANTHGLEERLQCTDTVGLRVGFFKRLLGYKGRARVDDPPCWWYDQAQNQLSYTRPIPLIISGYNTLTRTLAVTASGGFYLVLTVLALLPFAASAYQWRQQLKVGLFD
jgi:hypothetical protein